MGEQPALLSSSRHGTGPAPHLSILVPTYDRDVRPLCAELLADIGALPDPSRVELLVLIDGNPALQQQEEIVARAEALGIAAGLAVAASNLGRSKARNALAQLARGRFLQFLDADGLPDAPGFVARALEAAQDPGVVVCGGRTGRRMDPAPPDARLFELQSQRREWIPAEERNRDPNGTFLSANFTVARDLFLAHPFDERFEGWGWEDTEWALRIGRAARMRHVDNTVSHMEHHADAAWLRKLIGSAENYARLYRLYPEEVMRHRLFPLIRMMRPVAGWQGGRHMLRRLVLQNRLPASRRLLLLKILQAMEYAHILRPRLS
ncbi:glycosyltransferase [Roseomonas sp. SSH11]|uniref:Glycosyltransferase n=1 Tax=Pararoseomonas baculiformis TaxID=2820812 RepID=A0ABS4AJM6_9PROT|nr:glycosyltransferase family A protein [Pararoseomonas baculiformis]MBP0447231.1 glycosyltransferase [Pararoseomonas baculiformis]